MKTMTVGRLHKILSRLIADGHERQRVFVSVESVKDYANGVWDNAPVEFVRVEHTRIVDGDGFGEVDSKGREKYRWFIMLHGGASEPDGSEVRTKAPKRARRKKNDQ